MIPDINTNNYVEFAETTLALVGVRNDGIIEIRFKLKEYEVDVKDQHEIHDAFVKLTDNGRKAYHILVIPGKFGTITKEAREMEMFETVVFQNQRSLAIVVHELHQRILGKLYLSLKKSKPKYPNQLFDSEVSAMNWIQDNKAQKK